MDFTATLCGFGVGAIVGMTGVGGGSLMTPLLLSVFRLSHAVAIGTDLWFAAITKSAGAVSHKRAGHGDWRLTGLLLAGSIPAAMPERLVRALLCASLVAAGLKVIH